MTGPKSEVDLVVVGAGAAGLAAAKTARALGLSVTTLEASARIGGRAHTDTATFGVPYDRGCQLLHSGSRNPFTEMAREYGFTLRRGRRPRHIYLGDRWATDGERRSWARFAARGFAAMEAAGAAGNDVAATEVTGRDGRWSALFDAWVAVFTGVDAAHASTLDHAGYVDTKENWRVREGLGALIARYGADIPVALDTPVRRIRWHGPGVVVETPRGSVRPRAAIVTVSTGVLAADAIRFDPPLPGWKRDAIEALPLGQANKIALSFDRDVFGMDGREFRLFSMATPETILFQIRPFGWNMASGYVAGGLSAALEKDGADAVIDLALTHLKQAFGNGIARHVRASAFTGWGAEPWIRGAYSAARPGAAHRRRDLARPLEDCVFFAGEATSPDFFTTAHGAWLSGRDAAQAAATAIGAR